MVGIVIVSHSKKLADGVKELADQMVQGRVPVAAAGGIDDPDNEIGTDAMKVFAAIESVYDGDGVLVLMDLGSALMSAELAVEMLPEAYHSQVMLCEAPIVEGAMAAVVQADGNGTLGQVANEARGALRVKATQLGVELPVRGGSDGVRQTPDNAGDLPQITLTIHNKMGLHARPAAQFVSTVNRFHAEVRLTKGDKSVNAKSINQVATLGVRQGNVVTITAVGDDAAPALAAIQALADDNFGETDAVVAAAADEQVAAELEAGVWCGIAASPGIAIGPVFQFRPQLPAIELRHNQDPDDEWQRLQAAVSAAKDEINSLYQHARRAVGDDEAAIFQAHLLILQDPDLLQNVRSILDSEKINVEAAWDRQIQTAVAAFADLTDPYLQARAADAADVGNRVLRHLLGVSLPTLNMTEPVILVAADLTPSDTAQLDRDKILGICTELGGSTAHSAILARALGIPAIVGAGALPAGLADGQMIALDGSTGRIWPDPTEEQLAALVQEKAAWDETRQIQKQAGQAPAVTTDGHQVEVGANIGGPQDTAVALEYGAEGVGLFRTEFLFLDRETAPSEGEQLAAYQQAAAAMGKRPLLIRTLDVGGDKPLPYLDLGKEENPFLGWRGIRFCLDKPEIFKPQLRAILRAGVDEAGNPTNVKIMFPMIGTVDELRRALALLAEAKGELTGEGIAFDANMEVGVMVEVPSAVAVADVLAQEVDFFSLGTNDLTQYTMAADRGNANVASLTRPFQPAVLRLIQQTVAAAHHADIWVGMCGELAGNVLATPLLLGLGLDELSMSAPSIPAVKTAVRQWSLADAQKAAEAALQLDTTEAVAAYLASIQK